MKNRVDRGTVRSTAHLTARQPARLTVRQPAGLTVRQPARLTVRLTMSLVVALAACCLALAPASTSADKDKASPLANRSDVYCSGFISDEQPGQAFQVIGGQRENQTDFFHEGDIVYLNMGRENGIQPASIFQIIRPLGEFKHPFTGKKMGYYVREIGLVRVLEVQSKTSTAQVTVSCDTATFGDLLRPFEEPVVPDAAQNHPLARYGEGVGGITGRIVLSRGFHEYLSANQIVYIDLGSNDGVHPGDSFTIFRKIGKSEGIVKYRDDKINQKKNQGFESDRYRGGEYSVDTQATHDEILRTRPEIPRKVLGELVLLKVEKSTAVAVITRTNEEINIGDFIERLSK
jgi:hypothetical protein